VTEVDTADAIEGDHAAGTLPISPGAADP
jgi:hypothetical protein